MKETKFIAQNQEKWKEFEDLLKDNNRDPQRLNELFIQITDDLSYARTFYPNRSVRMYLNSLAQRIFHNIYRGKRFPAQRFKSFWSNELPQVIWQERRAMQLSLAIFVLAFAIGVLSSIINPDFARVVLGDAYIEMTLENIEKGDPMGVYKEDAPLGMTVGIAANNLLVALRTALLGVIASIGTLFIMLYNGIMVGAFQYFFVQQGLFWTSFLTIWIHGTMEISAIVLAGGAGLVAGKGFLFPGTYSRLQAFQISVRRGMKIFLGVAPMILLAAFFEGFATRYTDSPAILRATFILVSLAAVLWYFVWLPWHKARTGGFTEPVHDKAVPPDKNIDIDFNEIKTAGEVLSDSFTLLRRMPRAVWLTITGGAALFTAIMFFFSINPAVHTVLFVPEFLGVLYGTVDFFRFSPHIHLYLIQLLVFAMISVLAYRKVAREAWGSSERVRWTPAVAALILPMPLFFGLLTLDGGWFSYLLSIVFVPAIALWCAVMYFETLNPFRALGRTFQLANFGQFLTLGFLVVNLVILLYLFLDSGLWRMIIGLFSWLSPQDDKGRETFLLITTAFIASWLIYAAALLVFIASGIQYFTLREVSDAASLQAGIPEVGRQRQIRGLPRE